MFIFWSGLGLLVIPAVLVGYMLGTGVAGACGLDRFATSAGCFGAFCLLWLLCAAIYPGKAQRQEYSTGGKVLNLMGHSLFLIPAWLWRWFFGFAFVVSAIGALIPERVLPGEAVFREADTLLKSASSKTAHGNTAAAAEAAASFTRHLKVAMYGDLNYCGPARWSGLSTLCVDAPESVVFLTALHGAPSVPIDNAGQQEKMRTRILDAGRLAAARLSPAGEKEIKVGLRRASGYTFICRSGQQTDPKRRPNSQPGFKLGEMTFFKDFESLAGGQKFVRHTAPPAAPSDPEVKAARSRITRTASPAEPPTKQAKPAQARTFDHSKPTILHAGNFDVFVMQKDVLVLVGFQKKADGPSATLSPLFETLARSRKPGVCYGHVDYKHYPYVFRDYRIEVPEIWLYRDGKPLGRMRKIPSGEQLQAYINKLLGQHSTASAVR